MKKMLCIMMFVLAACPGPEQKESQHYDTINPSAVYITQDATAGVVQQRAVVEVDSAAQEGATVPIQNVTYAVTGDSPAGFRVQRLSNPPASFVTAFTYVILVGHTAPFKGVEIEAECGDSTFDASVTLSRAAVGTDGYVDGFYMPSTLQTNDYTDTLCQNGYVVWETPDSPRPAGTTDLPWVTGFEDHQYGVDYEGIDQNLYWVAVWVGRAWADPNRAPPSYTIHRVSIIPEQ